MSYPVERYVHRPEVMSEDEIEYNRLKLLAMRRIAEYSSCCTEAVGVMSNHAKFLDRVAAEIEELAMRIGR